MALPWDCKSSVIRNIDSTSQINRDTLDFNSKIDRDTDVGSRIIKVLNFDSTKN